MWTEILSFGRRQSEERTLLTGVVMEIDYAISTMRILLKEADAVVLARFDFEDPCENVRRIVERGGDVMRIECHVAPHTNRTVLFSLLVNEEAFDARMKEGGVEVEGDVVSLLKEVWKDCCVPTPPPSHVEEEEDESFPEWEDAFPLFPHQRKAISWMKWMEKNLPMPLNYAGNIKITKEWYVDVEEECFTEDPSWMEAHLCGGICSDGTGTGKTATALRHILTHNMEQSERNSSKGTLVIVPLNLVSQWKAEMIKFLKPDHGFRILWMVQGKDMRGVTMHHLCEADIVFTTFHFLRGSKPYSELVERALGGPRTRAALSLWARAFDREEPILEAVKWGRVVIDEMHSTFESTRDSKHLRLLSSRVTWGLTATPNLVSNNILSFLKRERPSHPNLKSVVVAEGVRGTANDYAHPVPTLELVRLSNDHRLRLDALLQESTTSEEIVKWCTLSEVECRGKTFLEDDLIHGIDNEIVSLRERVDTYSKAVEALKRSTRELECSLPLISLRVEAGDHLAVGEERETKKFLFETEMDLTEAQRYVDDAVYMLKRRTSSRIALEEQLSHLRRGTETCGICMERECGTITPCAHLFCSLCVLRHVKLSPTCPICRSPLRTDDLASVTDEKGLRGKLTQISSLLRSLQQHPVILFVQWKAMVKPVREFMKSVSLHILHLEGNALQRATTLQRFTHGGVLLLCMEDSFAGLHLPHARHVVFAHALVGNRNIVSNLERQAVARSVRHGQTEEVKVYSFIVADCEEERLWRHTH